MYRVLRDYDEVHERRRQATHPAAKKPELLATKPNQVYSWDITKLLGPAKWTYYYLYVCRSATVSVPLRRWMPVRRSSSCRHRARVRMPPSSRA